MSGKSFVGRYWPVGGILLAGLVASAWLGGRLHRQAVAVDRARFQFLTNQVMEALDARVEKVESLMRQAEDYMSAQQTLTDTLFDDWMRKRAIHDYLPWCFGLAFYSNRNCGTWRNVLPRDPGTWEKNDINAFRDLASRTPFKFEPGWIHAYGWWPSWFPKP